LGSKAACPFNAIVRGRLKPENETLFIKGYSKGLFDGFMHVKNVPTPFFFRKEELIDDGNFLFLYALGLVRRKMNATPTSFTDMPDAKSPAFSKEDAIKVIKSAYGIFEINYYTLGFMVGLARDCNLICGCNDVPGNDDEYESFAIGRGDGSFELTPKPYLTTNYRYESDREWVENKYRAIHELGKMVRLCEMRK